MILQEDSKVILTISDLQIPYEHPDAFDFIECLYSELGPDKVICMGDEVDQHRMARFDPDPDSAGAGDELKAARKKLEKYYELFEDEPEVLVCMSNHTQRIYKKAFHAGIPEAYLRPINEWLSAPDTWHWGSHFIENGVCYEHGDAQGGQYAARNLALRNRRSTVIGHHHSHGGVWYLANDDEMIFAMNTGCLIDPCSLAFKYAKNAAFKPTLGTGIVRYGVPYFVPMVLNKKGRWTGEFVI